MTFERYVKEHFHVEENIICLRMVSHPFEGCKHNQDKMVNTKIHTPKSFPNCENPPVKKITCILCHDIYYYKALSESIKQISCVIGVSNRVKMSHHLSFCKTPTICKITFLDLYYLICPIIELVFWYFVR